MKNKDAEMRKEDLLKRLATLYIEGQSYLGHYAWPWEEDRWHEMIVCAIVSAGCSPELARSTAQILKHLHIDTPSTLAHPDEEARSTIRGIFKRGGMKGDVSVVALRTIRQTAEVCMKQWGGKPQVFLRHIAEAWANDLTDKLNRAGMAKSMAHTLSVLWLQNVVSAPLLAGRSPAVQAFCRNEGVTEQELVEAADHVGLNIAVLDEILAMHHEAQTENNLIETPIAETSTASPGTKRSHKKASAVKKPR